eukprot:scaffold133_cov407-Prasinococcus_capsulatus_cf.AAC.25
MTTLARASRRGQERDRVPRRRPRCSHARPIVSRASWASRSAGQIWDGSPTPGQISGPARVPSVAFKYGRVPECTHQTDRGLPAAGSGGRSMRQA